MLNILGKRDQSRRYLGKATNLDNTFGPAWLAYGHSFAVENEHDQAMAAYFKASQLLKGLITLIISMTSLVVKCNTNRKLMIG